MLHLPDSPTRAAILAALPASHAEAMSKKELETKLGFKVRSPLESLYVARKVERRLANTPAARWLWWRL